MVKTFIGPQLRQLRRERKQTQAENGESIQRSLSVRLLMTLADAYGVDWRDIVLDAAS